MGWVTGTGGGISIKLDDEIYIAPSGVQKERIQIDDMFIQNMEGDDLVVPAEYKKLKKSQCTPLFMVAYRERNAGACIHTHSPNAVMVTLLWLGKEFRITHQEMIKVSKLRRKSATLTFITYQGIYDHQLERHLRFDEELVVPIIENTPFEKGMKTLMLVSFKLIYFLILDLEESLAKAIQEYPGTTAVLVRRHGIYVWGDSWQKAKTQCECYDYLFNIAIEMKKFGIDPAAVPESYK